MSTVKIWTHDFLNFCNTDTCQICGQERKFAAHNPTQFGSYELEEKTMNGPRGWSAAEGAADVKDDNDKVEFKSGATSGGTYPPYSLPTGFGVRRTAERFGYGNQKHEFGQTVLADANWLKAFHARDLEFFRDRISHAKEHLHAESQGRFDHKPGGNWGAVGWCVDIMPFVEAFDSPFYLAVVGLKPHPGPHNEAYICRCDRCEAGRNV